MTPARNTEPEVLTDKAVVSERAYLGGLLQDPALLAKFPVEPEDFVLPLHRDIYAAIPELSREGMAVDMIGLCNRLGENAAYVGDLFREEHMPCYVEDRAAEIAYAAADRGVRRSLEEMQTATDLDDKLSVYARLQEYMARLSSARGGTGRGILHASGRIQHFEDIPDIVTLQVEPLFYVVPALGIARGTMTLWAGSDGIGKTYLAQAMALAVAQGDDFLGVACPEIPVLYVDYENGAAVVQARLRALHGEEPIPNLRVWGLWAEQPAAIGSEALLTIARETQPLMIFDPFRYAHPEKENDSTDMTPVMQHLRACAACGAAVVILHHVAKGEGSTGRGSTAIRAACDLAFLHTLDSETNTITLKVDKNRHGARRSFTIAADFEEGRFSMTDAPYIVQRKSETETLIGIISAHPGISQRAIEAEARMARQHARNLLAEGIGKHWTMQNGPRNSKCFYPKTTAPRWSGAVDDENELENGPKTPRLDRAKTSVSTAPQRAGAVGRGETPMTSGNDCASRPSLYREGAVHFPVTAAPNTTPESIEKLCSEHGFHKQWCRDTSGVLFCDLCRQPRTQ